MKVYRIHITSWTASFRYPNLISGFQPSLVVPPLSTIYGLISAAAGRYICADDLPLGYIFKFGSQIIDLETIYQISSKGNWLQTKPNVIRRQILFDASLRLYIEEASIAHCFYNPVFQLLLGRSGDLASVRAIEEIELQRVDKLERLRGTIVPMKTIPLGAPIQPLPISFTNEIPRRNIGTRPFFLLEYDFKQPEPLPEIGFYDAELEEQIYWHDYRNK